MESIDKIVNELQISLEEGWEEFKESTLFNKYSKFYNMLSFFYNSNLRKSIPHPAYQLAAQHIGKQFMIKSRKFGLCYEQIFPGNFENSIELEEKYHQIRVFTMSVYNENKHLGYFHLSFSHKHTEFDFPDPPKLKFKED